MEVSGVRAQNLERWRSKKSQPQNRNLCCEEQWKRIMRSFHNLAMFLTCVNYQVLSENEIGSLSNGSFFFWSHFMKRDEYL